MLWADLHEQEQVRLALQADLLAGTVSHAVLITGPSGSGKRTWGKILARALLCPDRRGAEPCLECSSCRLFASGNHPNFFYVEPQSQTIKIEQIREIRGKFFFEGETRVCLINQAERMTAEAGSSLLKILEEPPEGLYFILLAERPHQLPSTIVSRCRHYSLPPLSPAAITSILEQRAGIERQKASFISRMSKGLPGMALEMAGDPVFADRIQEASNLGAKLSAGDLRPREILEQAVLLSEREDLTQFLEMLFLYYRDGLIRKLCCNEALLVNPDQDISALEGLQPHTLVAALELLHATLKELKLTNVNRRLAMEGLLIQLQRRFRNA
ncbi:MAG TPA: DNA polymerase III subunit delta' [Bacillota bacterium]|nr:DNA polymerase III subunit delta' [Bacillota bacterium]